MDDNVVRSRAIYLTMDMRIHTVRCLKGSSGQVPLTRLHSLLDTSPLRVFCSYRESVSPCAVWTGSLSTKTNKKGVNVEKDAFRKHSGLIQELFLALYFLVLLYKRCSVTHLVCVRDIVRLLDYITILRSE